MAESYVKVTKQLSGTVQAVTTVVGVATENYEDLSNKPRINGVTLSGDVTLEQLGVDLSGVLPPEACRLLILLLRHGVYTSDQNEAITALAGLLSVSEDGSGAPETPEQPEKTMTGISATYSGGPVTAGTEALELTDILVMARYSDGSSESVTDYSLYGTIVEGENSVLVSYAGFIDTITVWGIAQSPETFTVTNSLINVSNGNSAATVTEGAAYSATLTADAGYALDAVTVTMGGTDITSTAHSAGAITIAAVTGNVVITASAVPVSNGVVNLFDKNTMVTTGSFINTGGNISGAANTKYATVPLTGGKSYAMQRKELPFSNGSAGNITLLDSSMNVLYKCAVTHSDPNDEGFMVPRTSYGFNAGGLTLKPDDNSKGCTFDTTSECAYLRLTLMYGGLDATDTFMVEEGTFCHDYVAYGV